jgi:hypothetical protein
MLGLDFAPANSALVDLNLARVVGGWSRKPSKTVNLPPHHSSTEMAEPSFGIGDFVFGAVGCFTDHSGPFGVSVCPIQVVRSLSAGPQ